MASRSWARAAAATSAATPFRTGALRRRSLSGQRRLRHTSTHAQLSCDCFVASICLVGDAGAADAGCSGLRAHACGTEQSAQLRLAMERERCAEVDRRARAKRASTAEVSCRQRSGVRGLGAMDRICSRGESWVRWATHRQWKKTNTRVNAPSKSAHYHEECLHPTMLAGFIVMFEPAAKSVLFRFCATPSQIEVDLQTRCCLIQLLWCVWMLRSCVITIDRKKRSHPPCRR